MKTQRLQKLGTSYAVIVPATVRRALNWWPSDELQLEVIEGALVLMNATQHDERPVLVRRRSDDTICNRD